MQFKVDKKKFLEDGYCVVKSLLNDDEINYYDNEIKKLACNKSHFSLGGIYKAKQISKIVFNKNLIEVVKFLLGSDIYFLHDSTIMHKTEPKNATNWHRDNPCRKYGYGPDWDKDEPYNVLRLGIYLQKFEETNSCINVIPGSHKKRFTIQEILRFFHKKMRNLDENSKLMIFKNLYTQLIGKNIKTDPGDCVIFHANLWHTATPTNGIKRAIHFSFGTDNKHSKNFVNYYLKYRTDIVNDNDEIKMDENFLELLKENKIFYPIPEEKIHIPGVFNERK